MSIVIAAPRGQLALFYAGASHLYDNLPVDSSTSRSVMLVAATISPLKVAFCISW